MSLLRPAQPTDAGRVGAILSEFIDQTDWMPRIHTRAEDLAHAGQLIHWGWVTVADTNGVQGFLARDAEKIQSLYIAREARNAGLGKALLEAAKAEAEELTLWTFEANRGAQRFYEREGFAEVEREPGSANDEGLPAIRYHWQRKGTP